MTAGALPAGLSLSLADGVVTGTPTDAGAYSATVTATNAHGTVSRTFTGGVLAHRRWSVAPSRSSCSGSRRRPR